MRINSGSFLLRARSPITNMDQESGLLGVQARTDRFQSHGWGEGVGGGRIYIDYGPWRPGDFTVPTSDDICNSMAQRNLLFEETVVS